MCEVIIGNILELNEKIPVAVNAVTTRAQAAVQGKTPKPLNISVGELQKLQRDSADLQKWFNLADSGPVKRCGKKATMGFDVQKEIAVLVLSDRART